MLKSCVCESLWNSKFLAAILTRFNGHETDNSTAKPTRFVKLILIPPSYSLKAETLSMLSDKDYTPKETLFFTIS